MEYSLNELTWGVEEYKAGINTLLTGKVTMGVLVKQFEEEYAKMMNTKYAVLCNSGSSANLLILTALKYISNKLVDGDEVIVPAVSWGTTYFPIHQNNLVTKIVDVNINTLNIDVNEIEKNISEKTKAIFAVNILGNPCDYDRLQEICEKHNLILIEDNCESMYAKYNGKFCGTFGLMGSYSTFFSHHISTMEGGIVTTDDEECYQYIKSLRAHGWTRDLPDKNYVKDKTGITSEDLFNFIIPGYNVRPTEVNAAIGIEQLKKLPTFVTNRKKNWEYFNSKMKSLNEKHDCFILQGFDKNTDPSYFSLTIIFKNKLLNKRNHIIDYLKENNIESRPIVAGNFANKHAINHMKHIICGDLMCANIIDKNGIYLGNHSQPIYEKIDYFIDIIEKYIKAYA